jgi:hypothetical protein
MGMLDGTRGSWGSSRQAISDACNLSQSLMDDSCDGHASEKENGERRGENERRGEGVDEPHDSDSRALRGTPFLEVTGSGRARSKCGAIMLWIN